MHICAARLGFHEYNDETHYNITNTVSLVCSLTVPARPATKLRHHFPANWSPIFLRAALRASE